MAAPTIRPYNGVVPQRSQAPSEFANNADDWVAYQAPLAADYNALGDYVDVEAATIQGLATNAATSATNSSTSATAANTFKNESATSATNADTSAGNASISEANSAANATNAANSFKSFDERYLGTKTSDPTVDNDGDALLTGALYFNSATDNMRVWLGSAWANITNVTGSVDINGGTIDGTPIGKTTKSTGKFTTLEADAITATTDASINGLTFGRGAGNNLLNTVIGRDALSSNTTGVANTANGSGSLENNTTGSSNTSIGRDTLKFNTTGGLNTALGTSSLVNNTTGRFNTGSGVSALSSNTTGSGNTGISPLNSSGAYAPVFDPTTENNRFCMGSTAVTNAYIQVAWTVVSDERDKADFAPVPHGLDFVNQLNPTAFKYKENREDEAGHGMLRYGFRAQDLLALEGDIPVIVDNENSEKLRMVETSLIPVLVNAIKELTARIATLEGA